MSGGHFEYQQYNINEIAEGVGKLISENGEYWYDFSDETISEFKQALQVLNQAYVYAQRIDWLVSGDDGEESFHERLAEELDKLK